MRLDMTHLSTRERFLLCCASTPSSSLKVNDIWMIQDSSRCNYCPGDTFSTSFEMTLPLHLRHSKNLRLRGKVIAVDSTHVCVISAATTLCGMHYLTCSLGTLLLRAFGLIKATKMSQIGSISEPFFKEKMTVSVRILKTILDMKDSSYHMEMH